MTTTTPADTLPPPFDLADWAETHFQVVKYILENDIPTEYGTASGQGGWWNMALDLTNEFDRLHAGREWDGEFFDEVEKFLDEKLASA